MRLEIFKGFQLIDMIFNYEQLRFERKFNGAGVLELKLLNFENKEELQEDNIIIINDDAYIIENISQSINDVKQKTFEITGHHVKSLLKRRVVKTFTLNTSQTIETQILALINTNFINPTIAARKIQGFKISNKNINLKANIQQIFEKESGIEVYEIVEAICSAYSLGWHIQFNPELEEYQFYLIESKNKTSEVVFSEEYGNVSESEFYIQTSNYKNVAFVSNAYYGTSEGITRREIPLDDKEKITEYKKLISAENVITNTEQFKYKIDWDLGDIVSIENLELGYKVDLPTNEITETHSNKMELDVVFGDRIPTIFDKLKKER